MSDHIKLFSTNENSAYLDHKISSMVTLNYFIDSTTKLANLNQSLSQLQILEFCSDEKKKKNLLTTHLVQE